MQLSSDTLGGAASTLQDPGLPKPGEDAIKEMLAHAGETSLKRMGRLGHPGRPVAVRTVFLSRAFSAVVALTYFFILDAHPLETALFLVIPLAIAWFPNLMAAGTGYLGMLMRVSRPSPPRVVLVLAWIWLLLPIWALPILALFRG